MQSTHRIPIVWTIVLAFWSAHWPIETGAAPSDDLNLESIVIEAERINETAPITETLTREEIHRKFQEVLGTGPKEILTEQWVSNDTVLVTTHGRKYCVKFVPPRVDSAIDLPRNFAGTCLKF